MAFLLRSKEEIEVGSSCSRVAMDFLPIRSSSPVERLDRRERTVILFPSRLVFQVLGFREHDNGYEEESVRILPGDV